MVKIELAGEAYIDTVSINWGLFDCFNILNFLLLYFTLSVTFYYTSSFTLYFQYSKLLHFIWHVLVYLHDSSRNYNLIIFFSGLVYHVVFQLFCTYSCSV
jgi:hypothetical protein